MEQQLLEMDERERQQERYRQEQHRQIRRKG
jgi:hypothetical protein